MIGKRTSQAVVREIERLLAEKFSVSEIANLVGVDAWVVRNIRSGQHYWQQDLEERTRRDAADYSKGIRAPVYNSAAWIAHRVAIAAAARSVAAKGGCGS